jgi:hypothetical protein
MDKAYFKLKNLFLCAQKFFSIAIKGNSINWARMNILNEKKCDSFAHTSF